MADGIESTKECYSDLFFGSERENGQSTDGDEERDERWLESRADMGV